MTIQIDWPLIITGVVILWYLGIRIARIFLKDMEDTDFFIAAILSPIWVPLGILPWFLYFLISSIYFIIVLKPIKQEYTENVFAFSILLGISLQIIYVGSSLYHSTWNPIELFDKIF